MKIFKIVTDREERIRLRSKEIPVPINDEIKETLKDMTEYLKMSQDEGFRKKHPGVTEGVGLAAPQIGMNIRMLAIFYEERDEKGDVKRTIIHNLVNPKIIASSMKLCYLEGGEGCLSVPEKHEGKVYRNFRITVKAFNAIKNQEDTIEAVGLEAIVLQHEIDHLNGILYYDHFVDKIDEGLKKTAIKI